MGETRQPTIWGLGITFSLTAIAAVVLRFQARRVKGQPIGADDWTILVALILSIAVTADVLVMTQAGGLGKHLPYGLWGIPADPKAIVIFGKTTYALELLSWPTVGITKLSVLLLYKRIFSTPRFVKLVWALVAVVIAWTIAFTFTFMFSCAPIRSQWEFSIKFKCVDQRALLTAALVTDVATDFLILFLPIVKILKLQMPFSRKVFIMSIFLLGGLVSIIGLVRLHFLVICFNALKRPFLVDTTWIYAPAFYWTIVETNAGIISACLPTLRPIQEQVARKFSFTKLRSSFSNLLSSHNKSTEKSVDSDLSGATLEAGLGGGYSGSTPSIERPSMASYDTISREKQSAPTSFWARNKQTFLITQTRRSSVGSL